MLINETIKTITLHNQWYCKNISIYITPLGLASWANCSARVLILAVVVPSLTLFFVTRCAFSIFFLFAQRSTTKSLTVFHSRLYSHSSYTTAQHLALRLAVASFRVQCSLRSHLALRSPLSYVDYSSLPTL